MPQLELVGVAGRWSQFSGCVRQTDLTMLTECWIILCTFLSLHSSIILYRLTWTHQEVHLVN